MTHCNELRITDFQPRHAEAFRDLNLAWIREFFRIEPFDLEELNDPVGTVIRPGGAILVVEAADRMVGVCALLYRSPGYYEVSKMAVREDCRGDGVGRRLLGAVVDRARRMDAHTLLIISNTVLEPAMRLYRSLGFRETPMPPGQPYERGNIALELSLQQEKR